MPCDRDIEIFRPKGRDNKKTQWQNKFNLTFVSSQNRRATSGPVESTKHIACNKQLHDLRHGQSG
jgi:hypothetical protein